MPEATPVAHAPAGTNDLGILQEAACDMGERAMNALLRLPEEDREFLVELVLAILEGASGAVGHAQRVLAEMALLIACKAVHGLDFDEEHAALYASWATKQSAVIERLRRERVEAVRR